MSILRGLFTLVQNYCAESVGHALALDLRNAIYAKVQRLPFAFHDRTHSGDLITVGMLDLEGVRMYFSTALVRTLVLEAVAEDVADEALADAVELGVTLHRRRAITEQRRGLLQIVDRVAPPSRGPRATQRAGEGQQATAVAREERTERGAAGSGTPGPEPLTRW